MLDCLSGSGEARGRRRGSCTRSRVAGREVRGSHRCAVQCQGLSNRDLGAFDQDTERSRLRRQRRGWGTVSLFGTGYHRVDQWLGEVKFGAHLSYHSCNETFSEEAPHQCGRQEVFTSDLLNSTGCTYLKVRSSVMNDVKDESRQSPSLCESCGISGCDISHIIGITTTA
nr:hypothetical protein CFP56_42274 [Quercus suber]